MPSYTVKASTGSYALFGVKELHEQFKAQESQGIPYINEREKAERLFSESPELLEIAKLFKAELDLCMVMTGPLADKVAALTDRVDAAINRVEGN